jgi:cobalt-zinc-cadmium efflux system membrane fusion protein
MIHRLSLSLALALGLAACGNEPAAETHAAEPAADAGIRLSPAAQAAAGIKLQAVNVTAAGERIRAPGEVVENAYNATLITPRVEALVIRRHVRLGDEVRAGAPLATLASVEVSDAQAELRIADQEYRRVAALGPEAVAGRRITEARVALDRARARAQAYGLPGAASGQGNGQFTLRAPHAGRITEDDFVVGQRIEPGTPLFRLVDESRVWVDATLLPGTLPRLTPGDAATIVFDGKSLAGKVLRTAHRTSDTTRNATVRIEVPNQQDLLHAGDFVEVYLDAGRDMARSGAGSVTVPTAAVVQLQGDSIVFRREASGAFVPVPVRVGETLGSQTLVQEGLKPGDTIVVEGAFDLKAQMLKSQMGEGLGD